MAGLTELNLCAEAQTEGPRDWADQVKTARDRPPRRARAAGCDRCVRALELVEWTGQLAFSQSQ
jgi:hypothetical protein